MHSSRDDTAIITILKEQLIDSLKNVFTSHYDVSIDGSGDCRELLSESFSCNWISSSISFHGNIVGTVFLIVEQAFAQYLLVHMGLGTLSPDEESEYIQDAMGELLNVILGNTTNDLLKKDIELGIDPPQMFILEDGIVDQVLQQSWKYQVRTDKGRCCLVVNT